MAKQIAKYLYLWIGALSGAVVVLLTILFINSLFELHKPVMSYVEPVGSFTIDEFSVENRFVGRKLRDCKRIPDSEVGYYMASNVVHETTMTYIKDATPNSSFPPGVIDIGGIRWDKPDSVIPQAVGFTISHECEGKLASSVFWFEVK